MDKVTVVFNNENYVASYNKETGDYEVELQAPNIGGIYQAEISIIDALEERHEIKKIIQVLEKKRSKIETEKIFMWIFNGKDFTVKNVVQLENNYEIADDIETDTSFIVNITKETEAIADDIVAIKRNGQLIYWGIIEEIKNNDGSQDFAYTIKNILNIFNVDIALSKNIEKDSLEDGVYIIKTDVDTKKVLDVRAASKDPHANIQIWGRNDTDAQKWRITKNSDGFYTFIALCSGLAMDLENYSTTDKSNIQQFTPNNSDAQRWKIEHVKDAVYYIKSKINTSCCVDVEGASPTEGSNVYIFHQNETIAQKYYFEKLEEYIIRDVGIEDYIKKMIEQNITKSEDEYLNKGFIEVRAITHTRLQTSVTNVNEKIYNLHTYMLYCMKNYNINYNFFVENKKLIIEIENKEKEKMIIDINTMAISEYNEIFEKSIVSAVEVVTNTKTYNLYLLNDRTTTIDRFNVNRAVGEKKTIFVENYEDAEQKALDVIQANRYNHNVSFTLTNKIIPIGTPIAIKTNKNILLDTYISSIKINRSKFISYTCGNIRIGFIDKILKERSK